MVVMMGILFMTAAAQDLAFVRFGAFGGRGVDQQGDVFVFNGVDDVGAAFLDFVDAGGGNAGVGERFVGASGGEE